MKYFIIDNVGRWAGRKLLGLLPTTRAVFQARAAGAREVTILSDTPDGRTVPKGCPDDVRIGFAPLDRGEASLTDLAQRLAAESGDQVFVMDANFIFQRDFAPDAATRPENTVFSAGGKQVAAIRVQEGAYKEDCACGRANEIETAGGVASAKKMLYQGLKKPLLVNGLVAAFLQRPMAHVVTVAIVNTPIRPNHVTIFAGLVGVAGAVVTLLAGSRPWMMQLGVLLYFLGSVFDCIDGDLARLKYQFSYIGSWLDTIADDASTAAIMFALAFYQAQLTGDMNWFYFGAGAAGIFVLTELYIYYHLARYYHSGDVLDFQWAVGVKKRASAESFVDYVILFFKRDFFTLLLLVLGLFQVVHAGLVYMSVLMYLFGGYVLLDVFLSLRRPGWRTRP